MCVCVFIIYTVYVNIHFALGAVFLVWQRTSSIDMEELRVKPGDSVILYCDRVMQTDIVWFQSFSIDVQTTFNISALQLYRDQVFNHRSVSHLTLVWNAVNNSYDLVINKVRKLHRGLYYCAGEDKTSSWKPVYNFSKYIVWVSVTGGHVLFNNNNKRYLYNTFHTQNTAQNALLFVRHSVHSQHSLRLWLLNDVIMKNQDNE